VRTSEAINPYQSPRSAPGTERSDRRDRSEVSLLFGFAASAGLIAELFLIGRAVQGGGALWWSVVLLILAIDGVLAICGMSLGFLALRQPNSGRVFGAIGILLSVAVLGFWAWYFIETFIANARA
jgi:hypothetical protein